jgi:hypothetical protein
MSGLSKDELGFVRARGRGRTSRAELSQLLNTQPGEAIYRATVENGVRTSKPVEDSGEIKTKSGDTFSVGPRVTKAALFANWLTRNGANHTARPHSGSSSQVEQRLQQEVAALKRAGFGWAQPAQKTDWGWMVLMNGITLPNGIRTEAMVLLPDNYPLVSPIGFYVKQGAATAHLDTSHLFKQSAFHGAVDLSAHGWQWFCGIAEGWQPGRHTLVSYISIVFMLFNDPNS